MSRTLPEFIKPGSFASCDSLVPLLRSLLSPNTRCCKSRILGCATSNSLRKAASRSSAFSSARRCSSSTHCSRDVARWWQDFQSAAYITNSMCACLLSVTHRFANGTGSTKTVSTSASKLHSIPLMRRTVMERAPCVQKFLQCGRNRFTKCLPSSSVFLGTENSLFNVLSAQAGPGLSSYKMGADRA